MNLLKLNIFYWSFKNYKRKLLEAIAILFLGKLEFYTSINVLSFKIHAIV